MESGTGMARPRLSAQWQCGRQRRLLRQAFNTREIDAVALLLQYDQDKSGALDASEMEALLRDFNDGHMVSGADLEYILRVADANRDSVISVDEILHAVRTWYAYANLPRYVDDELQHEIPEEEPLPTQSAMRELLVTLNENQPVTEEEVQGVLRLIVLLGGTQHRTTFLQLRQAVADWYLNIERAETEYEHLARKSALEARRKLMELPNLDPKSPQALIAAVVVGLLFGVLPVFEIIVAQAHAHNQHCEAPQLSGLLWTTGMLTLAVAGGVAATVAGWKLEIEYLKIGAGVITAILILVWGTLEVYGITTLGATTSYRCGFFFWHVCQFVYCLLPLLFFITALAALPWMFLREFFRNKTMDRRLMPSQRSRGVGGGAAAADELPQAETGSRPQVERPPEAAVWQCGRQRLLLRQKLNSLEIDAAKLLRKYDADGSGVLEVEELQHLLQDFRNDQPVLKEDLDFILRVADQNRDSVISQDEVLFALRVWHAFENMPATVGAAFQERGLVDCPLPSVSEICQLLEALNEFQPVTDEEGWYVRDLAVALGATEERVTLLQFRRAVAAWYLHIQRGEMSRAELLEKSMADVQEKLRCVGTHAGKALSGDIDYSSLTTSCVACVLLMLGIAFPLFEIIFAQSVDSSLQCENPQLTGTLRWTGILTLLLTAMILVEGFGALKDVPGASLGMRIGIVVLLTVVVVLHISGGLQVMASTALRCGHLFFIFCYCAYILVPTLSLLFMCCGVPCLFCYEYSENSSLEEAFLKAEKP